MTEVSWIGLSTAEVQLVRKALADFRPVGPSGVSEVDKVTRRLDQAASPPEITIGVFGGLVQWTRGNPAPIRVIDYDGDEADLPDRDDDGHPCSIWIEHPDAAALWQG